MKNNAGFKTSCFKYLRGLTPIESVGNVKNEGRGWGGGACRGGGMPSNM